MERYTPRLILREFCPRDFEAVREYESRAETQRYEKVIVPSEEDTRRYLAESQAWALEEPRTRYRLAITIRPDDAARGPIATPIIVLLHESWKSSACSVTASCARRGGGTAPGLTSSSIPSWSAGGRAAKRHDRHHLIVV